MIIPFGFMAKVVSGDGPFGGHPSLATGCIRYWKMDEASGDLVDSTGNGDLTVNGAAYGATGIINDGMDLDGVNDTLTCSHPTGVKSLMGWVYFNQISSSDRLSGMPNTFGDVNPGASTGGMGFYYGSSHTMLRGRFHNASESATFTDETAVTTGTWYHVAIVADGSTGHFYVNGVEIGTGSSITYVEGSEIFTIGSYDYQNQTNHHMDGIVDEWAIYNKALTSSDVSDSYNSGAGLSY